MENRTKSAEDTWREHFFFFFFRKSNFYYHIFHRFLSTWFLLEVIVFDCKRHSNVKKLWKNTMGENENKKKNNFFESDELIKHHLSSPLVVSYLPNKKQSDTHVLGIPSRCLTNDVIFYRTFTNFLSSSPLPF